MPENIAQMQPDLQTVPPHMGVKTKRFLIGSGLFSLFLIGSIVGVISITRRPQLTSSGPEITENSSEDSSFNEGGLIPTGTPIPFQELTIPYLRNREYTSQLGAQEKLSETSTYTRYLSSYDSDGLKVNGLLTVPKGEEPAEGWPAIIFIHGYIAPSVYETTQNYESYVDYFARNGFVVFKIDLRGHDDSEGEASGAYYSGDYIVDTLNAYSALQSSDFVKKDGIGLWGHSMAGNVSMRSLAAKPDIPAVVIWAGAVYSYEDMQKYGIDDNSYRPPTVTSNRQRKREELRQMYGDFNVTSEFWKQVVPTNYLDGVTTSIQFHHAVDDTVVNIGYSRDVLPLLQSAGVEAEVFEYPSGGHNLTGATFSQAMQRSVEFFKEKLGS